MESLGEATMEPPLIPYQRYGRLSHGPDTKHSIHMSVPPISKDLINMKLIGMSEKGSSLVSIIRPLLSGCHRLEKLLGGSEMDLVAGLVRLFFYVLSLS